MVNGKPYISVKRATRNALNAPKDLQSRRLVGLKNVRAKKMKIAELKTTKSQKPYSCMVSPLLATRSAGPLSKPC
jgi:hypothetical protein